MASALSSSTLPTPTEFSLKDLRASQDAFIHSEDWLWLSWEFHFSEELELALSLRLPRLSTLKRSGRPLLLSKKWIDSHLEAKPLTWTDSRSWSAESKEATKSESLLASRRVRLQPRKLLQLLQPRARARERSEDWLKVVIQSDKHRANTNHDANILSRRVLLLDTRYYSL